MPWDGGHMVWMWFPWVIGLVLLVLMVRWVATSSGRVQERESPEETLKRRYARGEIEQDEYLRRLDDLRR